MEGIVRFLDLAPHLSFPPLSGGEKRAWHLFRGMTDAGAKGTLIARLGSCRGNPPVDAPADKGWRNHKILSALAALASGRDYWQIRMFSAGVRRAVAACREGEYDLVLLNFLYVAPLAAPFVERRIPLLVETHNYDPAYFGLMAARSKNPLLRALCRRAVRTSCQALANLPPGSVLVHVSAEDAQSYRRLRPDLLHHVVENGTCVQLRTSQPDYQSPKKSLMFVGLLSVQINQDALQHFAEVFWPQLKTVAAFRVVGANPTAGVRNLCARHGWELSANVSEAQLGKLYEAAHFAVLPFGYGAGSKLKLAEAFGRGVPVLATRAGVIGFEQLPPIVMVSDAPEDWRRRIQSSSAPAPAALRETAQIANRLSWPALAARMLDLAQQTAFQHKTPTNYVSS